MNCFIQNPYTSGYHSIPDAITTTTTDDDDNTTSSHRSSKRRMALVAGVMMMLVVVGGAVLLLRDGASSTTTTTAVQDLVVGESPGYCFYDSTSLQHCWYPTQDYHVGNWKVVFDRGYHSCGPECPTPPPTPAPTTPVYDPSHDYCFYNAYIEQHCWYPTQDYRNGNWKLQHIGGDDSCDFPECPPPPPPPPPGVYDPSHDWCFTDHDNPGKLCWYPTHNYPVGNWGGWDAAYGQCGDLCTDVYTPGQHDGDWPCLPATNTFGGVSGTNYGCTIISNSNPFQTCYQYGDEDKYCWSNSYWSSYNNGWYECQPNGFTGCNDDGSAEAGWHAIKQKNMRYVNPPPQSPGDPYTCGLSIGGVGGVPCQDLINS